MIMIRNIIWDMDGTLFDTYPAIARAFKAALHDFGKDAASERIEGLARNSLGYCAATLAGEFSLDADAIGEKFNGRYSLIGLDAQPPFRGVKAVCEYICSFGGKNVIVTHRGREGTAQLLAAHNMAGYFAGYLTRDDGYPKKPNPAAFTAIIQIYDLKREETIAVGDRDIDILAGQAAGLRTCLFGIKTDAVTADLTISDFDELYHYLALHG